MFKSILLGEIVRFVIDILVLDDKCLKNKFIRRRFKA